MTASMPNLRLVFASVAGTLLATGGITFAATDIEPQLQGDVLTFEVTDLDGNTVTHEDERFKHKVVLIDIWGTWCPPCREAIPELMKLQEEYKDEGLVVVGIGFERGETAEDRRASLRKYAEEHDLNYLILEGGTTDDVWSTFPALKSFDGFPTVFIVGRDGKVAHGNTVMVPRENAKIREETEKALAAEGN